MIVANVQLALLSIRRVPPPSPLQLPHKSFRRPRRLPALDAVDDADLAAAARAISDEAAILQLEFQLQHDGDGEQEKLWAEAHRRALLDYVYVPSGGGRLIPAQDAGVAELLAVRRAEHAALAATFAAAQPRVAKLESRFATVTKGFEIRSAALNAALAAAASALADRAIEAAAFSRLADDEAAAMGARLAAATALADEAAECERELQARYQRAVAEVQSLRRLLAPAGVV